MKSIKNKFLIFFLKLYLNCVVFTCRWKVKNFSVLKKAMTKEKPVLLSCWHENLVLFSCFFKNWDRSIWVVSSSHNDSQILANVLLSWKYKLITGSSTRGWLPVIKKLILVFKKQKSIVAVTHDGPKGPPKKSKPGALKLALKNKAQIIGMSGEATSFWRAKSWDKTILPKPFTTIYINFHPEYSGNNSLEKFNNYLNSNV